MKSFFKILKKYMLTAFIITFTVLILNMIFYFIFIFKYALNPNISTMSDIAEQISDTSGKIDISDKGKEIIDKSYKFAMILDDDGNVIWSYNLPEGLNRKYSLKDVASFSKWYLDDYPVRVWDIDQGLLTVGDDKDTLWKNQIEMKMDTVKHFIPSVTSILIANVVIILLMCLFFGYKFYKSFMPVMEGLDDISKNKKVHIPEKGISSEIAQKLNKTSDILEKEQNFIKKRDNLRTNWIAGVSHDIRTPLSMIVGYSETLLSYDDLDDEKKNAINIIKNQGVNIKNLIDDLNLTSKLQYDMQILRKESYKISSLLRETAAKFYNEGLDDKYIINLNIEKETENIDFEGDKLLLIRAFNNIIGNSIRHNETGCMIDIHVSCEDKDFIKVMFDDDGCGFTSDIISGVETEKIKPSVHIMGLLVVKHIIISHKGKLKIGNNINGGAHVEVILPCVSCK